LYAQLKITEKTMKKPVRVDDPFCLQLHDKLASLSEVWSSTISCEEGGEMLKLVAGLSIVYRMASGEAFPDRDQLNYILRSQLGTGHSWYTCIQFLSGQRARTIFAEQQERFRDIGGVPFMHFANHVLPDMQNNFYKIFAPTLRAA
jgi:hypothetical protein